MAEGYQSIAAVRRHRRRIRRIFLVFGVLLSFFFAGCCIGPYALAPERIFWTIFGQGTLRENLVIFDFRLPRLCLAVLVGLGMGSSGVMMQSLLRNDLASPGTLGVADGSSLFVTVYIALIAERVDQPILLPVLAMLGGIASAGVIYVLSTKKGKPISHIKLIMTGVAMGACYSAIGMFMMYLLDETQVEFVHRWQSGELWGTEWRYISILAGWLMVFGSLGMREAKTLNVIHLGYDIAVGLGVNLKAAFLRIGFLAVGIASASVAFGGNFFFLGLIGPHIARGLVGPDTRYLIPAAGAVSAALIVLSNILVENVTAFINIPVGIFISILSVPYFLYLLVKAR